MITVMLGGQPPQANKTVQLNDKMLALAQDLLIEEMNGDGLFACGDGFTCQAAGQYGLYEICNGDVISFQPKTTLNFTLISDSFVIRGDLATIQAVIQHLSDYELSVTA